MTTCDSDTFVPEFSIMGQGCTCFKKKSGKYDFVKGKSPQMSYRFILRRYIVFLLIFKG